MDKDPYEALGVAKTATQDEIKKAYRRIVKTSHPDINPGDDASEARFKAAGAAYDLLRDSEQRARFDRGEIDASGAERPERRFYREYAEQPSGGRWSGAEQDDLGGFADVFSDLFGEGRARRAAGGSGQTIRMRGPDLRYTLDVPFMDAARGTTTEVTLPAGELIEVRIPAGLADGQTLRLRGKGGEGYGGGPPGDALVTVTVLADKTFSREGDDIVVTLPIGIDEAILGGKIEAPTIDGPVKLTVPKGANSGQVLRLRGRGVEKRDGGRGDQRVELRIVAPPRIDPDLEAFMKTWRADHPYDPRKRGGA